MSGPTFLSFHRLNFLRLLRSLGLPCGKTRDVIDASIYRPKFSRKLRETTKITTQNKLLIISEDFYDNLRLQHIQIAQIHLDTDRRQWKFTNLDDRKWRTKRAMRSSSIFILNYGHSYIDECAEDLRSCNKDNTYHMFKYRWIIQMLF